MSGKLAWGIIGAGRIAGTFARGVAGSSTGQLIAIGSRAQDSADRFGDEFNVPRRHGSYDALLADDAVAAVYVATPHPMHAEWAIKTAEAGKHVLCEKPLALNHAEAMAIVEAARANDVFLMEAFMYRCHPQTAKLVELIRAGAIGEVRVIQATFGFHAGFDPDGRLFSQELGGGGILDVGCYAVSMARLVAGAAAGEDFAEPAEVKGTAHIGEVSRVDEYAIASLRFPGGIIAQVATAVTVNPENVVRIFGSEGWMFIPNPWVPGRDGDAGNIVVHRNGEERPEEIVVEADRGVYSLEADTVAANIENRQAQPPAMTWDDSLGNMRTLDLWRESIGLVYDSERPAAQVLTVSKRPLKVKEDSSMEYGPVGELEKPVSRLVMGVADPTSMPHTAVMFDDYFERGGNAFDTAYIYGGGACEKMLGQWVKNRDLRDKVVIIDKGAHSPFNQPEALARELLISLERLQMDYVDIYMAHRDNPDIPVGEWIDAFNEQLEAGRIRSFCGSNWSLDRIQAGNHYAAAKGLVGFAAVSNNFSLARMVNPVWGGCIAASDPESRAWLAKTQLPLLAWSSQARGFFTKRGDPDDHSDEELVHSWHSEDNFKRRERATELAQKRGVLPINIALAYVLCQPFPTFALIGPATLAETASSFRALAVELTPKEMRWLNLEE